MGEISYQGYEIAVRLYIFMDEQLEKENFEWRRGPLPSSL